jgi:hypothetical protein
LLITISSPNKIDGLLQNVVKKFMKLGSKAENILAYNEKSEISKICNYCHKNLFSYRKEMEKGEAPGRVFAFFAMKS